MNKANDLLFRCTFYLFIFYYFFIMKPIVRVVHRIKLKRNLTYTAAYTTDLYILC